MVWKVSGRPTKPEDPQGPHSYAPIHLPVGSCHVPFLGILLRAQDSRTIKLGTPKKWCDVYGTGGLHSFASSLVGPMYNPEGPDISLLRSLGLKTISTMAVGTQFPND